MEIRVVEATTAEELDAVRRLFREYAESLGWDLSKGGRLADEIADLPGPYAPPAGALLLAYAEDEPAGALGLEAIPEDVRMPGIHAERIGELKRLYVRPEARGRGIGRLLMERAEAEARDRGYDRLVLTTSAEMFPLAQQLYDSLGYGPTAVYRTDMPWPGVRWLEKAL